MNVVLDYIEHKAPFMIHFRPGRLISETARNEGLINQNVRPDETFLDAFIADKDRQYKNLFQVEALAGHPRTRPGGTYDRVEKQLFAGGYHKNPPTPEEHVKYGTISLTNATDGGAVPYGDVYLVLKDHVRDRITITPDDSFASERDSLGTPRHFKHVLLAAIRREVCTLSDVLKAARADTPSTTSPNPSRYLEAQIHGPLRFDEDFEKVVASPKYRGTSHEQKLMIFSNKYGIPLFWSDTKP